MHNVLFFNSNLTLTVTNSNSNLIVNATCNNDTLK